MGTAASLLAAWPLAFTLFLSIIECFLSIIAALKYIKLRVTARDKPPHQQPGAAVRVFDEVHHNVAHTLVAMENRVQLAPQSPPLNVNGYVMVPNSPYS